MSSLRLRVAYSNLIQSMAPHFPHCEFHHAVIQRGESQDLQIQSRVLAQDPGRITRSAKEYQRTQATVLKVRVKTVFLCVFLHVSTFRSLREVWRTQPKLVGRLFDDPRGDGIGGSWRGGFLIFRGAGTLLGACTNARFGFIRGVLIGNQGS